MKISLMLKTAVAVAALCGLAGLAQAQQKNVKDQAEYDLLQAQQKEADPTKKLAILTTWKEKYPESEFKTDRLAIFITTYQQLNQAEKMYTTAQELKGIDPKNATALYFLTALPPGMNVTTPQRLAEAEQNAQALSDAIPEIFKTLPAGAQQAAFDNQRRQFERQVITTQVWVATQRKDFAKVEKIYTDELKKNPNDAQSSYALGQAILATKDKARQEEALFHIGRAAYLTGPGALDPATQKKVQDFFDKTVTNFTGSKEDVQKAAEKTKASAFPGPDWDLESGSEKIAKQEAEMQKNDPQKYLWLQVKKALIAEDGSGATYFETIKGSGFPKLKGKLVSALPANKPKEITVAIMDDTTPEIKLVVDSAFGGAPPAGTVLEFETAVPTAFSADPFLVTADIEQGQITGWPAELMGAPAKKGGVKKSAPGAKKSGAAKK